MENGLVFIWAKGLRYNLELAVEENEIWRQEGSIVYKLLVVSCAHEDALRCVSGSGANHLLP